MWIYGCLIIHPSFMVHRIALPQLSQQEMFEVFVCDHACACVRACEYVFACKEDVLV